MARGLGQQMFFWGCDVRHGDGNLLSRFGMRRLERQENTAEGSSRYRMDWREGTVELHSFCAGWYPRFGDRVVFIRNRERLYSCSGDEPLTPGFYEGERHTASTADAMMDTCRPLVEWVVEYETWVQAHTGDDYRQKCWMKLLSRMGGKPWLPPEKAGLWREGFLADPSSAPRAKDLLCRKPRRPDAAFSSAAARGCFPNHR